MGSEEPKKLYWTAYVNKALNWRGFTKMERQQYKTDTKALLCRGELENAEIQRIQGALYTEQAFFILSRAYVPLALLMMYKRGVFAEAFSFAEFKHVIKIGLIMQGIDLSGHGVFRLLTTKIVDKHVGINEEAFALKKKQTMDDYLVQKNYFKTKRDNKL